MQDQSHRDRRTAYLDHVEPHASAHVRYIGTEIHRRQLSSGREVGSISDPRIFDDMIGRIIPVHGVNIFTLGLQQIDIDHSTVHELHCSPHVDEHSIQGAGVAAFPGAAGDVNPCRHVAASRSIHRDRIDHHEEVAVRATPHHKVLLSVRCWFVWQLLGHRGPEHVTGVCSGRVVSAATCAGGSAHV
jgi:hypothetical protein